MLIFLEWKNHFQKYFYDSLSVINDFGKCCYVFPQVDVGDKWYDFSDDYELINARGHAKPGVSQGLRMFIDVEAFETVSSVMGSKGFRAAISDPLDVPFMSYDGFYLATGNNYIPSISNLVGDFQMSVLSHMKKNDTKKLVLAAMALRTQR